MEENKDLEITIMDEDLSATHSSITMSPRDHSATTFSAYGIKRRNTLSNEAINEPRVKRLNTTGESDSTVLIDDLLNQLKQAREECATEKKHLSVYSALIDKLNKENDMKDKIIGRLQAECTYKNKQLQANEKTIYEFELDLESKGTQLLEKANFVNQLQEECVDKENQLIEKANAIKELQLDVKGKDAQLIEKSSLIEQLQEKCVDKENQLVENSSAIKELQLDLESKDAQLIEKANAIKELQLNLESKDAQLIEKANVIKELQLDLESKDAQLIEKSSLVNQLQEECVNKENQLIEKANAIKELQLDLKSKNAQLTEKANAIKELQLDLKSKNAQLTEKKHLIDGLQVKLNGICKLQAQSGNNNQNFIVNAFSINELQMECVDDVEKPNATDKPQSNSNDKETKPTEKKNLLKQSLKECIQKISRMETTSYSLNLLEDSHNDYFSSLESQANKLVGQKRYVDALIILGKAIELEEITQKRSATLTHLFSEKVFCHMELGQFQQALNAANSAFQHNSNDIIVLYNRAAVYLKLQQYSEARQDLENLLAKYPYNSCASKLLDCVQKCEAGSI